MADSFIFKKSQNVINDEIIDGNLSYDNYNIQREKILLGFMYDPVAVNGRCGFNMGGVSNSNISNRFAIARDYSGYAIRRSYLINFKNIKEIIITGSLTSNYYTLTSTGYCKISSESNLTSITDDWNILKQYKGDRLDNFSVNINCKEISDENYLYIGIMHGTEISSYTSTIILDNIEFIY